MVMPAIHEHTQRSELAAAPHMAAPCSSWLSRQPVTQGRTGNGLSAHKADRLIGHVIGAGGGNLASLF